jgi:vacuolar-type H+-ATPase subunit E/Vma4
MKLVLMIGDTSYRSILINWITEAAIGLGADSARINASEKELALINDQLISEVLEKIRTKTGRQINLQLSETLPLKSQGVVLTAADGRTAYNNQVKTRILRKEREIRMAIYNTLFTDNRKEP